MIQDYTWEDNSDDKVRIYTNVLHLLSAMAQEVYIYRVDKGNASAWLPACCCPGLSLAFWLWTYLTELSSLIEGILCLCRAGYCSLK